eukprot:919202-Heterocapsa_arctica.AAC.1
MWGYNNLKTKLIKDGRGDLFDMDELLASSFDDAPYALVPVTPVAPKSPAKKSEKAAGTSAEAADFTPIDEESLKYMQSGVKNQEPRGAELKPPAKLTASWADFDPDPDEGDIANEDIDVESTDVAYARAVYPIDNEDWIDDDSKMLLVNMSIRELMQ